MLIQCTKKLLDHLKISGGESDRIYNPVFSWHANLLEFGRKKAVVIVNDLSRFAIVLFGIKAKDFKNLDALILNAMKENLISENIALEIIEKYIGEDKKLEYSKSRDKINVAGMNRVCKDFTVMYYYNGIDDGEINKVEVAKLLNSSPTKVKGSDYFYPAEVMKKNLYDVFGE